VAGQYSPAYRGPPTATGRWRVAHLCPSVGSARFANTCSTAASRAGPVKELTAWI